VHFDELALQADAARGCSPSNSKVLGDHRHDFTGMKAGLLRGDGPGEGVWTRTGIHVLTGDLPYFSCQVLGGLDHR
jgi:hypothetical protein